MSVRTIVTCDRCGKECKMQEYNKEALTLTLRVTEWKDSHTYFNRECVKTAIWCKDCVKEFHLEPLATPPPTPEPTFEDTVREFIKSVCKEVCQNE